MTLYVGIDPGVSGAVAVIREDGSFVAVLDIPSLQKGTTSSVKSEVDCAGLRMLIQGAIQGEPPQRIVGAVERVNSRPGQSAPSTFSMGDSFGCCRATLAGLGVSSEYITPTSWKKHFGLSAEKEEARSLAARKFPEATLHLKKYVDRAEALLIAEYLRTKNK